jgi:hypothetical protein
MSEVVAFVVPCALAVEVVVIGTAWGLHGRRAGPRERALFVRWLVAGAVLMAAVVGWVVAGIAAFVNAAAFWRAAWVGMSAAVWLAYLPIFVWAVKTARRQVAEAQALDGGRTL